MTYPAVCFTSGGRQILQTDDKSKMRKNSLITTIIITTTITTGNGAG
ncbi:thr operon leader peptide [Erwinia sp. E602]|nr:thr operon leader peptide [Erwinia sp. E602]